MQLHEFTSLVDRLLPPEAAMPGDPVGLQVTSYRKTANRILVAYEVTESVVAEAISIDADVIVAFHPLIYGAVTTLGTADRVPTLLRALVRADIALYIVHTAFDCHPHGTSQILATRLGLVALQHLSPSAVPGFGMGVVGTLPTPMTIEQFATTVQQVCGGNVRYSPAPTSSVSTVALVGGSGMSFLQTAVTAGADVFVTADVKYHGFHEAVDAIGLIDVGHYEMEQFVVEGIKTVLDEHLPSGSTFASSVVTNPVRYQSTLQSNIQYNIQGTV